ncbi:arginine/serine-rich protein PNISR [Drosophila subpulchrella]|uniref:arginine/serine-rich protein PNISR n=1 Tax=Drosophila subpulchrella TaxID=1486046 RepID=UPI0018A1622A|nr:arginine/serine-rich protein PNISR [Drosophila subpulchrella]
MFPGGNGNADLGYNKHAHVHGHGQHGHGHNHNHNQTQFLAQPPPPPTHFSLPPVGGPAMVTPLVATGLPLAMQGGAGIDWAQLAQQWIHMRDASPVGMPLAPPPPIIGNVREYHQQAMAMPVPSVVRAGFPLLQEHGEADMDMDDENERGHGAETPPPPAPVVTQSQWLAASEAPGQAIDASGGAAVTLGKQPWNSWQTQSGKTTGNPTAHIPSLLKLNVSNPNEPQQQLQMQLQAQQQQTQQPTHPQAHQPHPHQHHLAPPHAHQPPQQQQESGSGSASSEIDANKRKMLPAWIREGLEKMEREKQRQLERQQPSIGTTDDEVNHVKQVSSKTLTTPVNLLNIANVASDSEDSIGLPGEARGELEDQQIGNELISKAGDISSSEEQEEEEEQRGTNDTGNRQAAEQVEAATENDVNGKNYEERLADLMLVVRRTLTEILLETTNEEIAAIASETLKAHRAKASSAQVIRKSALSSITGNLGLAAYGDSSSESEEDEDDEDGERQGDAGKDADKSVQLSAEELKARIRRSKRSFERVIDDIEDRVAQQELRDEQTLQRHRKRELELSEPGASEHRRPLAKPEPPGELASQPNHEKLQQFNGKRPSRKERTTRFSDNKDGKQSQSYVQQVVAAAAVAPLSSLSSTSSQKLKPVPNPATNLLQMPESVATMLSAADKALHKANKSSRKSKSKRRHSSTSSSSSSSSGSSSSSDSDDSSSSSSSASKASSSRGKRASRHGHRSHGSSSRSSKYERRDRDRERERGRDRDRGHRQHRSHFSGGSSSGGHRQRSSRRHRDSSHSGGDERRSSSYKRSSRPSSSRSHEHGSSSSGRKRHRTRSRSKSRSTHHSSSHAHSSTSSASHPRKRH